MKRFLTALLAMFLVASVSMAQTKPAKKVTTKAATTADTVHLKKDGSLDKRYKNNKAPEGPLKKDGTPDKRYKANKDADKKKS